MLSEIEIDSICSFLSTGICKSKQLNQHTLDSLIIAINCLQAKDTDGRTEYIFKTFLICGSVNETINYTHNDISHNELVNTIVYKQTNDIFLTVMGKYLFYKRSPHYKEVLRKQIESALNNGFIDLD